MPNENEDNDLQRQKALRGGNRTVVTKLVKEVQAITPGTGSIALLSSIEKNLEDKLKCLKVLDEKILSFCLTDEIEKEITEASDWEIKINETLANIREFHKGNYSSPPRSGNNLNSPQETFSPSRNAFDLFQETSAQTANALDLPQGMPGVGLNTAAAPFSPSQRVPSPGNRGSSYAQIGSFHQGMKLPKISLQRFDGNVMKFQAFWQAFKSAVYNNPAVSHVNKLNYLFSLLEGKAYRAVAGLDLRAENYENTIQILKTRFGKRQQIINAHMQALLQLQHCPNEDTEQLRKIFDSVTTHGRGLESPGTPPESYGNLFIPVLMSRMPKDITLQVARKTNDSNWDINEILKIIEHELDANEMSATIAASKKAGKTQSQRSLPGTTQSFVANGEGKNAKLTCYFCKGPHFSYRCQHITDARERKDILLKAKGCFNCMKTGHFLSNCDSTRNCVYCKGRHHQSICSRKFGSKEQQTKEQDSTEQQESATDGNSMTTTAKKDGSVMLQTATAYVYGNNKDDRTEVKILFDNGSTQSYVIEELKRKLSLETEKKDEAINLNTFVSIKYRKVKCDRVKVNVELDNGEDITISAITHPIICSPLNSRISLADHPHLSNLRLADRSANSQQRVDFLVGADFYFDIVSGEVQKGSFGPTAINSKLDWLLSGPISNQSENSSSYNVISHLVIDRQQSFPFVDPNVYDQQPAMMKDDSDELKNALKTFWEQEAGGLHGNSNDDEQTPDPHKGIDIQFDGTKYEVSLPWKEKVPTSLPSDYDMCLGRLKSLFSRLKDKPDLLREYNSIFIERWKNEYILSLMEAYRTQQVTQKPLLKIGDVVILKNENMKHSFWKLCRIVEFLSGKDGHVRAAKILVLSQKGKVILKRPLQHLIPLEVQCSDTSSIVPQARVDSSVLQKAATCSARAPQLTAPPQGQVANQSAGLKRNAATIGELIRRNKQAGK